MFRLLLTMMAFQLSLLSSQAQVRFGYCSYEQALKSLTGYETVQNDMASLRKQYDAEMKRAEEEFNKKYEEFLDGQREFAPSILQKRQSELQELLSRNVAFKQEAARLLANAEAEAMAPLHQQLAAQLRDIGQKQGLAFILNTDNNACPYIDPLQGIDVGPLIK